MKTLSIIIPVYNEEATLQELVEKVINVDLSIL
jgi:glycosyltransferase involved in cell wall biosynthesis